MPKPSRNRRPPAPTSQDTIEAFLARSRRPAEGLPLRRTFVQGGTKNAPEPGPLAHFVKSHDGRGLDLYLLTVAVCSGEPHHVTEPAAIWARSQDISETTAGKAAISKVWRRLERRDLIERSRAGRLARVGLLKEDGSGEPYVHPGKTNELYFKVPFVYWTEEWHRKLTLPGKAMLLIALERPDAFVLPYEWAQKWYGISGDTAMRGLQELRQRRLIEVDREYKPAPLSLVGYAEELLYTLKAPFGPKGRLSAAATRRRAS